jgi:hypothetical protein
MKDDWSTVFPLTKAGVPDRALAGGRRKMAGKLQGISDPAKVCQLQSRRRDPEDARARQGEQLRSVTRPQGWLCASPTTGDLEEINHETETYRWRVRFRSVRVIRDGASSHCVLSSSPGVIPTQFLSQQSQCYRSHNYRLKMRL